MLNSPIPFYLISTGHHQVAAAIMLATDVGIMRAAFDGRFFGGAEDGIAAQKVVILLSVAAQGVGSPLSATAHVAIEITVISLPEILRPEGGCHPLQAGGEKQQMQCLFHGRYFLGSKNRKPAANKEGKGVRLYGNMYIIAQHLHCAVSLYRG